MSVVGYRETPEVGCIRALRQLRDPLVLFVAPVTFAVLTVGLGYLHSWPVGFDFRGTLWEPAHALLEGAAMYPEPTRQAVLIGNPSVYPPFFILVSVPLALVPVSVAAWTWFALLAVCVLAAMWVLDVRDWRCHVLALTSPVVVHGLFYGNLTVALVLLVALGWRYRDRAPVAGVAIGAAIAAKLFLWPLVLWLLLTRRVRAAAWAAWVAATLVFGAWTLIGFQGLLEYPALLREVQEVYALRGVSLASVAGSLGAPSSLAAAVAWIAGVGLIALAALRFRGDERRALALIVGACIVASPIVWPNYLALLLIPIAITWPRLSPVWLFGYLVWLVKIVVPEPTTLAGCCAPPGIDDQAWAAMHAGSPGLYAAGSIAVVLVVALLVARARPGAGTSRAAAGAQRLT